MQYSVSDAAERNKGPLLEVLSTRLAGCANVLEIGSGTGQHALYFAANLPHLSWQPSDTGEYLQTLREHLEREGGQNLLEVIELDVRTNPWPVGSFDGIFSANTLHIMSWGSVQEFFRGVGAALKKPGVLCVYGPFKYSGRYTSQSNGAFDTFLRNRDPHSGIRDFVDLDTLARQQGLELVADHAMPANNQLLVWQRPGM
jgi:cyclopropane fatty-acyl-phospholipid synthase-like methyltransferase